MHYFFFFYSLIRKLHIFFTECLSLKNVNTFIRDLIEYGMKIFWYILSVIKHLKQKIKINYHLKL